MVGVVTPPKPNIKMKIISYIAGSYGSEMRCDIPSAIDQLIANPVDSHRIANSMMVVYATDAEANDVIGVCETRGLNVDNSQDRKRLLITVSGTLVATQEAHPESLRLAR